MDTNPQTTQGDGLTDPLGISHSIFISKEEYDAISITGKVSAPQSTESTLITLDMLTQGEAIERTWNEVDKYLLGLIREQAKQIEALWAEIEALKGKGK